MTEVGSVCSEPWDTGRPMASAMLSEQAQLLRRSILQVEVVRARNLLAADPNGKSDPYCVLSVDGGGTECQTKMCLATLEPEWKQSFTFMIAPPQGVALGYDNQEVFGSYLKVDVWDHDRFNSEDFLGRAIIPLTSVWEEPQEAWHPLGRGSPKDKVKGEILLNLQFSYRQDQIEETANRCASPEQSLLDSSFTVPADGRQKQSDDINSKLYKSTKRLSFHLPVLSGRKEVLLPGPSERVEIYMSDVIVQMGSAKCVGQVYLTDYRLVIIAQSGRKNWLRYDDTQDLTTYVPLNSIKSVEKTQDDKWIQRHSGTKHSDAVAITIHCHDVRSIKLLFVRGTNAVMSRVASDQSAEQEDRRDSQLMAISTVTDQDFVLVDLKESSQDDSKSSEESQDEEQLEPVHRMRSVKTMMGGWRSQPSISLRNTSPAAVGSEVVGKAYSSDEDLEELDTVQNSQTAQAPPVSSKSKRAQSDVAITYLKIRQGASDAAYFTSHNRVLVRAGKPPSFLSIHQKLANALHLRLDFQVLNGSTYPPALNFSRSHPNTNLSHWDVYNFPREMKRQGVTDCWHLSAVNGPDYEICNTYPALLYFPTQTSKDTIVSSAAFRSKGRLPTLVWFNSKKGNFMLRSAQPLTGANYKRSQGDEDLLRDALVTAPPNKDLVIFDARTFIAAGGNRFRGKGTEDPQNYKRCRLVYLDIPNIHAVRDSMDRLQDACLSPENDRWLSLVESTSWLNYISLILKGSTLIVRCMDERSCCTLVHCSDGWDRTAQLCSLAQLMMDPFYRTIDGFIILIEKEWISFGHKFRHRLGHPNYPNERSPIFLQFLDCVYQILAQNPNEFEFSSELLLTIANHLHSGWFGTFLCNSECERNEGEMLSQTLSLWAHIMSAVDEFRNPSYHPSSEQELIYVEHNIRRLRLWQEYYLRYDSTSLAALQGVEMEGEEAEGRVHSSTPAKDLVVWMDDSKASECTGCGQKFNIMRRKHHCRACGRIFCNDCTKHRTALPQCGFDEEVRICDLCYQKVSEPGDDCFKDSDE